MEAKELMIDDWVVFHDSGYASDHTFWEKDRVCQIDSIDTYVRVKWYDEDGCEEWPNVSVTQLSPIPFTSEILEKNGFVKLWNQYLIKADKEPFIHLIPLDNLPNANGRMLVAIKDRYTNAKIAITYVHELQNALRLCRIKKEIKL